MSIDTLIDETGSKTKIFVVVVGLFLACDVVVGRFDESYPACVFLSSSFFFF